MTKIRNRQSGRELARKRADFKRFADGISNPLLRIGTGTLNTFAATTYKPEFVTMGRQLLEWAYQSSWLCGLAVDIIAEDMTREGIDIQCDVPEDIDKINAVFDEYGVFDSLCEGIKWARLYGGAIAVMLIDGQKVSDPLIDIPSNSFKGLLVLDRWQLDNSNFDPVQKLGRDFGKPCHYRVVAKNCEVDFGTDLIHHSRVIRLEGRRLPFYLRQSYQGWGASVLEPLWDRIKGFDLATEGVTQLLSKAYLRYYRVKGFREILTNSLASEGFKRQMDIIREFQNAEGLTVGDIDDDFQTLTYTFTGIPEILLQLGQQVSGALGIPLVRLFGQSPAGLNATGDSDIRMYYDSIKKQQRSMLRSGVKKVLDVAYKSATGKPVPTDLTFDFRSLWQMSQADKANVSSLEFGSIRDAFTNGLIDLPTALKELKTLSDSVGIFASITDEDIAEAERQEAMDLPEPSFENGNFQKESQEVIPGANPNQQAGSVVSGATSENL